MNTETPGGDQEPPGGFPISTSERAELEQLRAEVARLRERAETGEPASAGAAKRRSGWRWFAVGVLCVLVALLAITSVTSRFVRGEILDTDRYLTTVAPLASEPTLQAEITDTVTDEIFQRIDVEALTANALNALSDAAPATANAPRVDRAIDGLAPVLAGQARTFVQQTVSSLVTSDQFETLWVEANRRAHAALVAVVTGDVGPSSVTVDESGTVSISLGTVIENVKKRLLDSGFTFAEKIPAVDKQFVLFRSPELIRAQRAVSTLDTVADVLPWLAIACALGAVAIAPRGRRLRALSLAGLSLVVGMLVLAISLIVVRALYLDDIPAEVLSPDAAAVIADTVTEPLRLALRAVAVLGLVIAIGAYLIGGSSSAAAVRHGFSHGLDSLQHLRKARPPNAFETTAYRARIALRATVIGIAAVLLMFWNYPTGLVVLLIAFFALVTLLVIEIVIRPARAWQDDATV
ncbi:hypothetical protein M0655_22640 [Gordonia amicalis]|uniref:hypothetical protein n=1 Tax=Gordonia TaxID=2053 RepID=UPI000414EF5F|nr:MULTISPECIES: hypothetical protein [Gordonia]MCR8898022.1 hypothetical protein [Gordonia sp. GONU]UPW13958.1 hypothetical protein M0655_22640 [Gordonia amicalis]